MLGRRPQSAADRVQAGLGPAPKAAPFKRNDQLLEALPIGVVVFPGSGSPTTSPTKPGTLASRCSTSARRAPREPATQLKLAFDERPLSQELPLSFANDFGEQDVSLGAKSCCSVRCAFVARHRTAAVASVTGDRPEGLLSTRTAQSRPVCIMHLYRATQGNASPFQQSEVQQGRFLALKKISRGVW